MGFSLTEYLKKYKAYLGFALLIALFGVFLLFFIKERELEVPDVSFDSEVNEETTSNRFYVDINGQVNRPGVYQVDDGMILLELVEEAGGFTESADMYYVAKDLNLSKELISEQKVYIPQVGESSSFSSSAVGSTSKVSINNGSAEELDTLPGVGPSTVEKIISNRPYEKLEDLLDVSGIGESRFEDIKDLISL